MMNDEFGTTNAWTLFFSSSFIIPLSSSFLGPALAGQIKP